MDLIALAISPSINDYIAAHNASKHPTDAKLDKPMAPMKLSEHMDADYASIKSATFFLWQYTQGELVNKHFHMLLRGAATLADVLKVRTTHSHPRMKAWSSQAACIGFG